MTAVIIGIAFIILGIMGFLRWSEDLMVVLRGLVPLSIFLGGVIALIAGLASFRPPRVNGNREE